MADTQIEAVNKTKFSIPFTITKVDVEKRQVWGRATEEVPDDSAAHEVFDYESSVPFFQKWSSGAQKRTSIPGVEMSLGNIRRMHRPEEAGKVIAIDYNQQEKAIDIGTYCYDDDTWGAIRKGILTGFSVGGEYDNRWFDGKHWRYTADPHEISYVDVPAVPTATFKLVKFGGAEELHKVGSPLDDLGATESSVDMSANREHLNDIAPEDLVHVASGQQMEAIPTPAKVASPNIIDPNNRLQAINPSNIDAITVTKLIDALKTLGEVGKGLLEIKQADEQTKLQKVEKLTALGSLVGIARKADAKVEPLNGQPQDASVYADPANWEWLVDKSTYADAVAKFNKGADRNLYSPREWNVLGRHIVKLANQFGKYTYNPLRKEITMATQNFNKADVAGLLSQLQAAMGIAADQIGSDPQAVADLIMNALGSVSSANVGDANPTAPTGQQGGYANETIKTATMSTPSTMTTMSTPDTTATKAHTVVVTPASSSSPSSSDEVMKALEQNQKDIAALTALMGNVVKAMTGENNAPVVAPMTSVPAGMFTRAQQPENPILKALTSGVEGGDTFIPDRNALRKAAVLAGSEQSPDYKAVEDLVYQQVMNKMQNEQVFTKYYAGIYGGMFAQNLNAEQ